MVKPQPKTRREAKRIGCQTLSLYLFPWEIKSTLSICFILNFLLILHIITEQKYICSFIFIEGRVSNPINPAEIPLHSDCAATAFQRSFCDSLIQKCGKANSPTLTDPCCFRLSYLHSLAPSVWIWAFIASLDYSTKDLLLSWRHPVVCSVGSEFPNRQKKHMLRVLSKAEIPKRCFEELYF